jgi:hypothetical protein
MFYKCKVKKALGKMALWLLPKRGLLRVGAKANVPLCGGKKMNKKCAVGKKEKIQKCRQRVSDYPLSRFNMVCLCLSVCQNGLLFLFVRPLLSGCTVVCYACC